MDWPSSRASQFVTSPSVPRERVGHYWIDLARGYQLHGDHDHALASLLQARQISPLQTRFHPQVHETVRALVHTKRSRSDSLAGFARWAGVQV